MEKSPDIAKPRHSEAYFAIPLALRDIEVSLYHITF